MKHIIWAGLLIFAVSTSLIGCGPATLTSGFAGTWTTNLGMMNFVQNNNELIGNMEGYGGNWNETFVGTIDENGEAAFDTAILGGFKIVLNEDGTFKSTSTDLSFCGIRGVDMELPAGCGFSGKWIVPSKHVFLPGSYMILAQVGQAVTGEIFDGNGNAYESFNGKMDWGKGWRANGRFSKRGEISLWMNAAETGFEFMGDKGNLQQLCAIREGVDSAYLGSYYCEP